MSTWSKRRSAASDERDANGRGEPAAAVPSSFALCADLHPRLSEAAGVAAPILDAFADDLGGFAQNRIDHSWWARLPPDPWREFSHNSLAK